MVGGAWVIMGAREELWVVVVAHGGMDQADSVGEEVIELSSFFNLLSVSHPLSSEQIPGPYSEEKTVVTHSRIRKTTPAFLGTYVLKTLVCGVLTLSFFFHIFSISLLYVHDLSICKAQGVVLQ